MHCPKHCVFAWKPVHKPWNKEQIETNMVLTLTLSDFQERPKITFTFQNMFFFTWTPANTQPIPQTTEI